MYKRIFNIIKGKIPRISDTELIALQSGNVSIDRDILNGKISYPKKYTFKNKFPREKIDNLLNEYDNTRI